MRTVNITIYHGGCACIMKKKNAVFLKNKIYSQCEQRLDLKVYVHIFLAKMLKYVEDIFTYIKLDVCDA